MMSVRVDPKVEEVEVKNDGLAKKMAKTYEYQLAEEGRNFLSWFYLVCFDYLNKNVTYHYCYFFLLQMQHLQFLEFKHFILMFNVQKYSNNRFLEQYFVSSFLEIIWLLIYSISKKMLMK